MQNNFQSLSYFIPEITIVITLLLAIVSDLFNDLKKYTYYLILFGLSLTGILLFLDNSTSVSRLLFNDMLIFDSVSYYFKCIILFSTFSIILVSRYSKELDDEYRLEFNVLLLVCILHDGCIGLLCFVRSLLFSVLFVETMTRF